MEKPDQKSPFIMGFDGTVLNKALEQHLLKINPAGVILFKRNIESLKQTRKFIADLYSLLGDIVIAVDHEGGIVNRFPSETPVPPSPAALASTNSWDLVRDACKLQAELMAYLGFNMNFVPLVDLALFTENQVIGTRAFSNDPQRVAKYGRICFEEHENLGVGTTAKHFPSHGRTITDSHYAVGEVAYASQEQLHEDLQPYEKAIGFGIPAIMTAHLSYPLLDKQFPASLSKSILTDLLRKKLGFEGIIISDCVEMEGLSKSFFPEMIIEAGLEAGIDLFISSFSLKRSEAFQLSLKKAYDQFCQNSPDMAIKMADKTKAFLKAYPPLLNARKQPPKAGDAVLLHQKTLEKRIMVKHTKHGRKYHLVELQNDSNKGINADTRWNAVSDEIIVSNEHIVGRTIIQLQNVEELKMIVDSCNNSGVTLLALTANGHLSDRYNKFIRILKTAKLSIHIALLDPADLRGICDQEWATRGFNSYTGKMLATALDV